MNIQKAMRVRAELKSDAVKLNMMINSVPYVVAFEGKKPEDCALATKRSERQKKLDGLSYADAVKKLFDITDACLSLNCAIEKVNQNGHELLFKETAIKSKLSYIERLLDKDRDVESETTQTKTDYENTDAKGNFKKIETKVFNYPILDDKVLGASLVQIQKNLIKELEAVRDEIAAFNATQKVDWEMPDSLK